MAVICGKSLSVGCGCVDEGTGVWLLGALISVLMLLIRPPKKDVLGLEASVASAAAVPAGIDDDGGGLGEE